MTTRDELLQSLLVCRVRDGATVTDAASALRISLATVSCWRARSPRFRERLTAARREREREEQEMFLSLVRDGASVTEAIKRIGHGPAKTYAWIRAERRRGDSWFEGEYRRWIGPSGSTRHRCDRFFDALSTGSSIPKASIAAGWCKMTAYRWQTRRPDLWARVVETMAAAKREGV